MYVESRDVPQAWTDELRRLFGGPNDRVSWLELEWYPGVPYEPVGRWAIYEVTPQAVAGGLAANSPILAQLWADCRGPSPRIAGHWEPDGCGTTPRAPDHVEGHQRWVSDSNLSLPQWRVAQRTKGLPTLIWIIEGTAGGHAWQWGATERALFRGAGLDDRELQQLMQALPDPGTQAYADFDQRVTDQLLRRDRLRTWKQAAGWDTRTPEHVAVDRETARMTYAQELLHWVEAQIADFISDVPRTMLGTVAEQLADTVVPQDTSEADLDRDLLTSIT